MIFLVEANPTRQIKCSQQGKPLHGHSLLYIFRCFKKKNVFNIENTTLSPPIFPFDRWLGSTKNCISFIIKKNRAQNQITALRMVWSPV